LFEDSVSQNTTFPQAYSALIGQMAQSVVIGPPLGPKPLLELFSHFTFINIYTLDLFQDQNLKISRCIYQTSKLLEI